MIRTLIFFTTLLTAKNCLAETQLPSDLTPSKFCEKVTTTDLTSFGAAGYGKITHIYPKETFSECEVLVPTKDPLTAILKKPTKNTRRLGNRLYALGEEYCRNQNGKIEVGNYITEKLEYNKVFVCFKNSKPSFLWYLWRWKRHWSIIFAEPNSSDLPESPEFFKYRTSFYATAEEKKRIEEIERREQETKRTAETLLAKQKAIQNDILKREIGTKICREQNSVYFLGFVEAISPNSNKIQIRVANASYKPDFMWTIGGFSPHIIWDDPGNWQVCE